MSYAGEQKRQYQLKWIKDRRQSWIDANGPCNICGSYESLEVDHIDSSTKLLNPSRLWSLNPKNPRRIAELAKCQVLCQVCHSNKSISEMIQLTHGTEGATLYRNGCRCTECKTAQVIRVNKWRKSKS